MSNRALIKLVKSCILATAAGFYLVNCTHGNSIAGNSTDFGNARVTGKIVDSLGLPSAGTLVKLIPADYSGAKGSFVFPVDTTDESGAYSFAVSDTLVYNVLGVRASTGERLLHMSVQASSTAKTNVDTLRATGTIRVELPDSLSKVGAKISIRGTSYSATVDSVSAAVHSVSIDSLPAGQIPEVLYTSGSGTVAAITLYNNIVVVPGVSIIVDNRYSAGSSRTLSADTTIDLQELVNSLNAGDTMKLHGGTYHVQSLSISAKGNAIRPIVIQAVNGEHPVLRPVGAGNNLINIQGACFLKLDGLEFDSTSTGDDVIRISGDSISHDIVIANCIMCNYKGRAVNSQGAQYNISIIHCHMYNSTGMYSGGINVNSLDIHGVKTNPHHWTIQGNLITDIADSAIGNQAVSMYPGCYSMIVSDNNIRRAHAGGISSFGYGGENITESKSTVIERNFVCASSEAIGVYGDGIVKNNIVTASTYAFLSNAYNGAMPASIRVFNNTFYNCQAISITAWDSLRICLFTNNAVFAIAQPVTINGGQCIGNIGDQAHTGFTSGTAVHELMDPAADDFYPRSGSLLIGSGSGVTIATDDFNSTQRDSMPDVGAYEYAGTVNPGWKISEEFKQ